MKLRWKRLAAIGLSFSMMVGMCACGRGDAKVGGTSEDGDQYEKVVFAYQTFNNVPSEESLQSVQDAVNEISKEKIGVEVELKVIPFSDYNSQVSLSLQGGEQIDIFETLFNYTDCVSSGMAADITDLAPEYAKEALELVGEEWMKACTSDGKLYAIPVYKPLAMTPMITYRKDIAEELQINMDEITNVEQLAEVFDKVKEAHPDMIPLAPIEPGDVGFNRLYNAKIDYLSDDYTSPKGVLIGEDMTVVDLFETEEFEEMCHLARDWYNKGYIMKDAATTTSMGLELMSSGNYFCTMAAYSYPEKDAAASLETQYGYPIGAKVLKEAYLDSATINMCTFMVASTSKVPEAAMKFLNLTYTDKELINLLVYGIEGRDYVLTDEGTVAYPEGEDASTVPYTAQLSCGTLGNFFNMYLLEGNDPAQLDWELEQNKTAENSPAMGFVFDNSSVKTQYTAINNAIEQYVPGLLCGNVDPDTEIPKLLKALEDAGMKEVLEAKQTQLNEWLEEQ